MLEFIEQAIKLLVDKPDEVKVDIVETETKTDLRINCWRR